ncbi:MAG: ATP-binding protein [Cyanobacteria bacterium P01_H01_bin.26]
MLTLLLAQEIVSVAVSIAKYRAVSDVSQTFQIKLESERLLRAAFEASVALREYLLTDNDQFLEQYQDRHEIFQTSLNNLTLLFAGDSTKQENLIVIETLHERWEQEFAQKIIDGTADEKALAEAGSLAPLREAINRILTHERAILAEQNERVQGLDRLNAIELGLNWFGICVIVFGSGLNFILLRRRIILPMRQLIQVGNSWRMGQLEHRFHHVSEDEMGYLAIALNGMAKELGVRQARTQQRNQQLEDLISTLSHDLRTPLLANRSMLNAMIGGAFGPVSNLLQGLLKEYSEANDNLIRLVETLLDISRYEAVGSQLLNHEPLQWEKICNRVLTWIKNSSEDRYFFEVHIAADVPTIYGDAIEIQRVLQNLLDNAVRVSNPGQVVTIEVSVTNDMGVHVAVYDQGPGVKDNEIGQLFYRFAQATCRQGRAGLGLYLCRQIIEAHGGKIWVENRPGQGATFGFTLPPNYPEMAESVLESV